MVFKRKSKKVTVPPPEESEELGQQLEPETGFFYNLDELEKDGRPTETMEDEEEASDDDNDLNTDTSFNEDEELDQDDSLLAPSASNREPAPGDDWIENENQLAIDVFQDQDNIYIKAAVPGMDADDIDINVNNDMVTIRGRRHWQEEMEEDTYFFQECYWGNVSRSIILPVEIDEHGIDAVLKNGVLTVVLPKIKRSEPGTSIKVKHLE